MRWLLVLTGLTCYAAAAASTADLRTRFAGQTPVTLSQRSALETAEYILDVAEGRHKTGLIKRIYRKGKRRFVRTQPAGPKIDAVKDLGLVDQLLADLEADRDPFAGRTGDMHLAYRSGVDGSLQPFRLFIPESFDRSSDYPLVVILHGSSGDENTYFDRYASRATGERVAPKLARDRGYIVVCPRGRAPKGNYTGASEQDVLDVIDRVMDLYPIRRDQVFLTGHSLGGVGTWKIGFRHADRFAALAAVGSAFSAQTTELGRLPLAVNSDKPLLYCQGRQDRLATNSGAKRLVEYLQPKLPNFVYREFPDGHNTVGTHSLKTVFDFFDQVREGRELMASDAVSPAPVLTARSTKRRAPGKRAARRAPRRAPAGS